MDMPSPSENSWICPGWPAGAPLAVGGPAGPQRWVEIAVAGVIRGCLVPEPGLRTAGPPLPPSGATGSEGAVEVLIARRPEGAIRGGLWELPGGKVAPGESTPAAAARELLEETGIQVAATAGVVIGRVEQHDAHLDAERSIALTLVLFVVPHTATPRPLASAECRWERLDQLDRYPWPTANLRVNQLLRNAVTALQRGDAPGSPSA